MKLRASQVKEDWLEERKIYRVANEKLVKESKGKQGQHKVRKELRRMVERYKVVYEEGRQKHKKKVQHLKKRKEMSEHRKERKSRSKKEWIKEVASGTGPKRTLAKNIPIYGDI